jgi:hypothetical protein
MYYLLSKKFNPKSNKKITFIVVEVMNRIYEFKMNIFSVDKYIYCSNKDELYQFGSKDYHYLEEGRESVLDYIIDKRIKKLNKIKCVRK